MVGGTKKETLTQTITLSLQQGWCRRKRKRNGYQQLIDFDWLRLPSSSCHWHVQSALGLLKLGEHKQVPVLLAQIGLLCVIRSESKKLKNEIRSVDATTSGWLVCIICYPPFNFFVASIFGVTYEVGVLKPETVFVIFTTTC